MGIGHGSAPNSKIIYCGSTHEFFLCLRYTGYCLYHLFKNNIYKLKFNITVRFKIALTFSFSHLLILSLSHSLTYFHLHLWHTLFHTYTVHLSFIPKYLQVKKKEAINHRFQCTLTTELGI